MMKKRYAELWVLPGALALALAFISPPAWAQGFFEQFKDPIDGRLDTSQRLSQDAGYLAAPIFISDPAVDYGIGVAVSFVHELNEEDESAEDPPLDIYGEPMLGSPPSVTAAAAAITANDSWAIGGFHRGSYRQDGMRYEGDLGFASLNLNFYGLGDDGDFEIRSTEVNLEGIFTSHEVKFRWKESDFFIGGRYQLFDADFDFSDPDRVGDNEVLRTEQASAGLLAVLEFDTRDNTLSPQVGHRGKLEFGRFSKSLGGDGEFWKGRARSASYWRLSDVIGMGVKFDLAGSDGDVPFYDLPYIRLRGIGSLRYQGDYAFSNEWQFGYDFDDRWTAVGFAGVGVTFGENQKSQTEGSGGVGFRYLLARRFGLRAGLDVAQGPEDTVVYVQFGTAWN